MAMEYVPPRTLSEVDDDVIHARMLENLPADIDKTDGGFAHDFTRPAALEKAELMIAINEAIQIVFPAWSYAGYLDNIAAGIGLSRKKATAAAGDLSLTGAPGTYIPKGFAFATPKTAISSNIEFEAMEAVTIGADGTVTVPIQCVITGRDGNVLENSITLMSSPIGGIATIKNEKAMTGGAEDETDDDLRERIQERERNNEASFIGNDSDYRRWAKEVDGVGDVTVVPEWMGKGTGTVKLIIMDANGSPANQTILAAVYNHIISPEDRYQRLAPIGSILTVSTATLVPIDITASITLEEDADIESIRQAFAAAFIGYFEEAKAEGFVRYTRVGSILSETPGVLDYTGLKINSGIDNVEITIDDYPSVGIISFAAGTVV